MIILYHILQTKKSASGARKNQWVLESSIQNGKYECLDRSDESKLMSLSTADKLKSFKLKELKKLDVCPPDFHNDDKEEIKCIPPDICPENLPFAVRLDV